MVRHSDPTRSGGDRARRAPDSWEPEIWREDAPPAPAPVAPAPARARRPRAAPELPDAVRDELHAGLGPGRAGKVADRLAAAVNAYDRDRYQDALRLIDPLAREAPTSAAVRELRGLTLYRLGRWAAAVKELEAFHALGGSFDQHPVLADCHRATRRWAAAEAVVEELRRSSPSAEVLTEGRIVLAGARADQGDLAGAVEVLERARVKVRRPRLHHLRLWYALADLYERAGEMPRARELFRVVAEHDPGFVDAAERAAALT